MTGTSFRKTKYVRDLKSLVMALDAEESAVSALIDQLKALRIIHESQRDELIVIKLSHDYLVERLDYFRHRIRAIWPCRILNEALRQYEASQRQELATTEQSRKLTESLHNGVFGDANITLAREQGATRLDGTHPV